MSLSTIKTNITLRFQFLDDISKELPFDFLTDYIPYKNEIIHLVSSAILSVEMMVNSYSYLLKKLIENPYACHTDKLADMILKDLTDTTQLLQKLRDHAVINEAFILQISNKAYIASVVEKVKKEITVIESLFMKMDFGIVEINMELARALRDMFSKGNNNKTILEKINNVIESFKVNLEKINKEVSLANDTLYNLALKLGELSIALRINPQSRDVVLLLNDIIELLNNLIRE